MVAVIKCDRRITWTAPLFGRLFPYLIPVLGKPLLEYYVDYCILCNVSKIVFVVEKYNRQLFDFISRISACEIQIKVELSDSSNAGGEAEIVFDGFAMPCYDKRTKAESVDISELRMSVGKMVLPNFLVVNGGGIFLPDFVALRLESVSDYYRASMTLLEKYTDMFSLRGYSAEKGIFFGINDSIMYRAHIDAPVIVGDNSQIGGGSQIGPNVIVGKLSLIDSNSSLSNSIVLDMTYIGKERNICGKIVTRDYIIDPHTLEMTPLEDPRETVATLFYRSRRFAYSVLGRLTAVVLLIPILPFSMPFVFCGKPESEILSFERDGRTVSVPFYKRSSKLRDIWFFKLLQDKLPRLFHVVVGNLSLVGDSLQSSKNPENIKYYGGKYRPGAFTCADCKGVKFSDWKIIDDLHYKNNRTMKSDMQVILRTFISRLFGDQSK